MGRLNRGIFTYVQNTEPTSPVDGDTWFNGSTGEACVYHEGFWNVMSFLGSGKGYIFGGINSSGSPLSNIQSLTFQTEVYATTSAQLAGTAYTNTAFADIPNGYGYSVGGYSGSGYLSRLDRLTFSAETCASITTQCTTYRSGGATPYCSHRGYVMGGYNSLVFVSSIDRFLFGSEAMSAIGSNIGLARAYPASFMNVSVGYMAGGYTGSTQSRIDRILFASDVTGQVSSNLVTIVTPRGMTGNSGGYSCGGNNGATYYTRIDKLLFSTEAVSSLLSTMSVARSNTSIVWSKDNGYINDGYDGVGYTTKIDRLRFYTEVVNSLASTLATTARNCPGVPTI